jgi:methionine synthase I (cobalamin-dependent)
MTIVLIQTNTFKPQVPVMAESGRNDKTQDTRVAGTILSAKAARESVVGAL